PYKGKPLGSHQYVSWRVRVWDRDGKPSAWSQAAIWSMGLLKPTDLTAQWIGHDASRKADVPVAALDGVKWIWHAGDKDDIKPSPRRLFVARLDLPADARVEKAQLLLAADDASKFAVNGTLVARSEGHTHVVTADVAPQLRPGANSLRVEVENK